MKAWRLHRIVALLLMPLAVGCSYIKSYFPDKERDYQFRTEIPELIIPEDLKNRNFLPKPVAKPIAETVAATTPTAETPVVTPVAKAQPAEKSVEKPREKTVEVKPKQPETAINANETAPQITVSSATVSSLQIDQPQKQAWRLVSRALSLQKVEISERNLDKAYFYVKYDPDEVKPVYQTTWDELMFLLGDDQAHEQEYRITLSETGPQMTEVTVQDTDGKTLSNNVATRLLKLITDGINQDLSPNTHGETNPKESAPN